MHFFRRLKPEDNHNGFTLIEILVVISIISLLSSILLAALKNARSSAVNISVVIIAKEYELAFQRYYLDHNTWPTINNNTDTTNPRRECLGNIACMDQYKSYYPLYSFNIEADLNFQQSIQQYMPYFPDAKTGVVSVSNLLQQGLIYRCLSGTYYNQEQRRCHSAEMYWPQSGTWCSLGTRVKTDGTNSICQLTLSEV